MTHSPVIGQCTGYLYDVYINTDTVKPSVWLLSIPPSALVQPAFSVLA
jgi:hypothetical protein